MAWKWNSVLCVVGLILFRYSYFLLAYSNVDLTLQQRILIRHAPNLGLLSRKSDIYLLVGCYRLRFWKPQKAFTWHLADVHSLTTVMWACFHLSPDLFSSKRCYHLPR